MECGAWPKHCYHLISHLRELQLLREEPATTRLLKSIAEGKEEKKGLGISGF